ncbi:MAG: Rdx family protein [Planctomycetes bacterium]|nr:Rdx family protein [Planctomycetota bacterium]
MEADLKERYPESEVELIKSGGGVFEVECDGELVFSKKKLGRFPAHDEVFEEIDSLR